MDKIDFSSFYKFLTSLGLSIIVFAFGLQWIFLKELTELKQEHLNLLPQESAEFIKNKHNYIIAHIDCWFWFLVILGSIVALVGIWKWYPRQKQEDKKQELDNRKIEIDIEKQEKSDQEKNIKEEIDLPSMDTKDILGDDFKNISTNLQQSLSNALEMDIKKYIKIEESVISGITKSVLGGMKPYQTVKFGKMNFDLIIEDFTTIPPSFYVFEIKYYSKSIYYAYLNQGMNKFLLSASDFAQKKNLKKSSIRMLMIWVYKDSTQKERLSKYRNKCLSEIAENGFNFKIEMIEENKIESISAQAREWLKLEVPV